MTVCSSDQCKGLRTCICHGNPDETTVSIIGYKWTFPPQHEPLISDISTISLRAKGAWDTRPGKSLRLCSSWSYTASLAVQQAYGVTGCQPSLLTLPAFNAMAWLQLQALPAVLFTLILTQIDHAAAELCTCCLAVLPSFNGSAANTVSTPSARSRNQPAAPGLPQLPAELMLTLQLPLQGIKSSLPASGFKQAACIRV